MAKGVVRSKISCVYVKVDGLGETLLFTRTKSNKNWLRTGVSNMQILSFLFLTKFHDIISNLDLFSLKTMISDCLYCENDRSFNTCAHVLVFGAWHRLLLYFNLFPAKSPYSYWSTRSPLTNLIGWLFCDVKLVASFAGLFRSAKVKQKSFLSELSHISANFCPISFG